MVVSYKTELKPTKQQIEIFERDLLTCRKVYNLYLTIALKQLKTSGCYGKYDDFLIWFYKSYMRNPKYNSQYTGILNKDAIRNVCKNADKSLSMYSRGKIPEPKTKDLKKGRIKLYFLSQKQSVYTVICERHRIFIPFYGWIRLKEKGYIPTDNESEKIISGSISEKAGRYFVSVNVERSDPMRTSHPGKPAHAGEGIGIDLGLNHFAVLSDGRVYESINKGETIKRVNKHIFKLQRALKRKLLSHVEANSDYLSGKNFEKNSKSLAVKYKRSDDIRENFINNVISDIISTDPKYIAIEDLHVRDMVKERNYSRAVSEQTFREFRIKLQKKCLLNGIELRIINRWFPSSKRCHNCGRIKKNLRNSDRIYKCTCGYIADRDFNASLNIRDTKDYYVFKLDGT